MRTVRRPAGWLTAIVSAALVSAGVTWWYVDRSTDVQQSFPVDQRAFESVEVLRRDVEVVVALDAVVQPLPRFSLFAPVDGAVWRLVKDDTSATSTTNGVEGQEGNSEPAGVPVESDEAVFQVGSTVAESPVDARLVGWHVPEWSQVRAGIPVAELEYVGFGLTAQLPVTDAYRLLEGQLTATGRISGGPAGFECTMLQAPLMRPQPDTAGQSSPAVVCAIPAEVRAYADVPGVIALRSGQVEGVLTLPLTAVAGGADLGEVSVLHGDGSVEVRRVELGVTDGAVVEIVSGLNEGDQVIATPPALIR